MALFAKKDALETIQGKVEAFTAEMTKANAAVEEAQAKVSAAQTAKADAADQNDAAAFAAAKKQLSDAETALEMATMRKTSLVEKGAVPEKEIDEAIRSYRDQISKIDAEACAEMIRHIDKVIELANDAETNIRARKMKIAKIYGIFNKPIPAGDVPVAGALSSAKSFTTSRVVLADLNRDSYFFRTARRAQDKS